MPLTLNEIKVFSLITMIQFDQIYSKVNSKIKSTTYSKRCTLIKFAKVENNEEQHLFTETKGCKSHFPLHSAVWRGIHRQLPMKIRHCQGTYRLSIDNEAQC